MTKQMPTIDYASVLSRIPAAQRIKVYEQILNGREGSPIDGLETQFIDAVTSERASAEQVSLRIASVASLPPGKVKEEAEEQLVALRFQLALAQERLSVIGAELGRIQDALEEARRT